MNSKINDIVVYNTNADKNANTDQYQNITDEINY